MNKGDIVKLSQRGLDYIYGNSPVWRDRAKDYRYIFWGYPHNKFEREHGIVSVKRQTSYSFLTFHKDFIELAQANDSNL